MTLPFLQGRHPGRNVLAGGDQPLPVLDVEGPDFRPRTVGVGALPRLLEAVKETAHFGRWDGGDFRKGPMEKVGQIFSILGNDIDGVSGSETDGCNSILPDARVWIPLPVDPY